MKHSLLLFVGSSLLAAGGCNRDTATATAPVTSAKPVAATPAAAGPSFDVLALAHGTLAAFDPTTLELVLVVEERGPVEAVKVTRFAVADAGEALSQGRELGAPVGAPAAIAKTYGTAITTALQGLRPLAGVGFKDHHASPSQGVDVEYVPSSSELQVTSAGQTWVQSIDGGGVVTPQPVAAFAVPGMRSIAVFLRLSGDEVQMPMVRVFDLSVSPEDAAFQAAAEARLKADADCPSGDRHDCYGKRAK